MQGWPQFCTGATVRPGRPIMPEKAIPLMFTVTCRPKKNPTGQRHEVNCPTMTECPLTRPTIHNITPPHRRVAVLSHKGKRRKEVPTTKSYIQRSQISRSRLLTPTEALCYDPVLGAAATCEHFAWIRRTECDFPPH